LQVAASWLRKRCSIMIGKRFVKRGWGWYLVLLNGKNFKVKLLRFKRGGKLSRQIHHYRNELWLHLHDGTYREIRKGELHSYWAYKPTYVIEVQYGEKCVEEDILRIL
jgi:hypothetical protein